MENITSNLDYLVSMYGYAPKITNVTAAQLEFNATADGNFDNIFVEGNISAWRATEKDDTFINTLVRPFASLTEICNGLAFNSIYVYPMQQDEVETFQNNTAYVRIYNFNK